MMGYYVLRWSFDDRWSPTTDGLKGGTSVHFSLKHLHISLKKKIEMLSLCNVLKYFRVAKLLTLTDDKSGHPLKGG